MQAGKGAEGTELQPLNSKAQNISECSRRGGFGDTVASFLQGLDEVQIEERKEDRDAESRVAAVRALAAISTALLSQTSEASCGSGRHHAKVADGPGAGCNNPDGMEITATQADSRCFPDSSLCQSGMLLLQKVPPCLNGAAQCHGPGKACRCGMGSWLQGHSQMLTHIQILPIGVTDQELQEHQVGLYCNLQECVGDPKEQNL